MISLNDVRALCERMGLLDANGDLLPLDSLRQIDLIVEAEALTGLAIPPEAIGAEMFVSIDAFTAFLQGLGRSA